ncbi:MAG: carbohydrate kinase family protein [Actinomycetota bacterium]
MLDVITIGSASIDIFFITKRGRVFSDPSTIDGKLIAFSLGAKISIEDAHISDGGGALNAATCFARLGLKVAPHINIGQDELGQHILTELVKEGVDTKHVWMDERLRTGTAVILIPEGEGDRTVLFYSGANRDMQIRDWHKLENTKWIYMGPITRQKPSLPRQIVEFANSKSIKIANNPGIGQIENGFDYMAPILKGLDVLVLNRFEAALLLKSKDPNFDASNIHNIIRELIKTGPKIVVVTSGPEGSYASDGKEIYFQESIKTEVLDATGAGDAYGSTFVASLIKGYDIQSAMLIAAINSASVVSKIGAQEGLLRPDEIGSKTSTRIIW